MTAASIPARLRFKARINPGPSLPLNPQLYVSFLPMEAIGEDGSLQLNRTRAVSDVSQGYTYFENGDVSIAKITPCFENGKGAVMDGLVGGIGFGTTELIVLRPADDVDSAFLYYLTQSSHFRQAGKAAMQGAGGQKRVPDLFVMDFTAAWPALPEQRRIAAYLDAELARIDDLLSKKAAFQAVLTEMRSGSVTDAITSGIRTHRKLKASGLTWVHSIPADWKTVPLKRLVRLVGGHTPATGNPAYWDGNVPWFSPKDMKADELFDSIDHVTLLAVEESGLSVLEPDTTLIVVRGMILAHTFPVCVSRVAATINQDMKALVIDEAIEPSYLPWLLRGSAPLFLSLTEQSAHGTMALRTDRFMSEPLPIPPLAEQREIAEFLTVEREKLNYLSRHVEAEMKLLEELRLTTISDAVHGRIDVRGKTSKDSAGGAVA